MVSVANQRDWLPAQPALLGACQPTHNPAHSCPPHPAAVLKEKDLLKLPAEAMPLEQCALLREHLTAYRLLEDHALKVGWWGG